MPDLNEVFERAKKAEEEKQKELEKINTSDVSTEQVQSPQTQKDGIAQ